LDTYLANVSQLSSSLNMSLLNVEFIYFAYFQMNDASCLCFDGWSVKGLAAWDLTAWTI
jgi:hypothetical protein